MGGARWMALAPGVGRRAGKERSVKERAAEHGIYVPPRAVVVSQRNSVHDFCTVLFDTFVQSDAGGSLSPLL